jgi:hypothetical protein
MTYSIGRISMRGKGIAQIIEASKFGFGTGDDSIG